ncbi:hypothetical protein MMC07_008262 [Pseudocyphellaria aurata]|nr:hypothetical protein [Pseudocyphellaria aurata]
MTEVLSISAQPDGSSFFGRPSPLRRSSSRTSFLPPTSRSYPTSAPDIQSFYPDGTYDSQLPPSIHSSAPSSPRFALPEYSNQPSYTSTPSSSLSLEEQCSTDEEDILFPSYEDEGENKAEADRDLDSRTSSERIRPDDTTPPARDNSPTTPYRDLIDRQLTAGDDTALRREPTRHVDYLTQNWNEEDIWSSWRHIIAKRRVYDNSPRLENALWRTWTKSKYRLKTVSPDTLNWMKDHDVTWLYGPLQTGMTKSYSIDSAPPASCLSRSNSFGSKKPILKKRSLSEMMLQHSLSSSTLMKQAIDALRAQQPDHRLPTRPILGNRALSDLVTSSKPVVPDLKLDVCQPTAFSSASNSGAETPCTKRHIHFNDKVEQCIAINKGGDDHEDYYGAIHDESSSDDELLTMKPVRTTKALLSHRSTPRNSFSCESKTIAMLPSTTLKYRGDTPEPAEQKSMQKGMFWNSASKLSPSPSQETLKPRSPPANFLLDDEDDDADMSWEPSVGGRNSVPSYPAPRLNFDSGHDTVNGLHRTSSGMFMPCAEDEENSDQFGTTGILRKVVDTVNTAKDIAHVIWNVGWQG